MVHHDVCPLCSSDRIEWQLTCTDHFVSGLDFQVLRCSACEFMFTQDYPVENEIGRFYESSDYISHSDSAKGFSNKVYRFARKIMLRRKRRTILNATKLLTGNLLDIGSGTGYFAGEMKKAGWHVSGIEINEKARNFSVATFGITAESPTRISELPSESYDCITLWHVLEHFHDPFKYISEIKRLLKPGSVCVIALPNCNSPDAGYYKRFWAAWDVPRHLWHFKPETFRLFSEKSGLILEKQNILPLDVFYISQLSEKYKGSPFPFLQGMLKATFFSLLSLFSGRNSSSLIYILRKPLG